MKSTAEQIKQFADEIEEMLQDFTMFVQSIIGSLTQIKKDKGGKNE